MASSATPTGVMDVFNDYADYITAEQQIREVEHVFHEANRTVHDETPANDSLLVVALKTLQSNPLNGSPYNGSIHLLVQVLVSPKLLLYL